RISLLLPSPRPWELLGGALARVSLPNASGSRVWSVPLMTPVQRFNVDQEMAVDSSIAPIDKIAADGWLQADPAAFKASKAPRHVDLKQANTVPPAPAANVTLWTRSENRSASQLELCDDAKVTTSVHKEGQVYQR